MICAVLPLHMSRHLGNSRYTDDYSDGVLYCDELLSQGETHEHVLEQCRETIDSSDLLDAIYHFLCLVEEAMEAESAQRKAETRKTLSVLIQAGLQIALEAVRVVRWSKHAKTVGVKIHDLIIRQNGMSNVYAWQCLQESTDSPTSPDAPPTCQGSFNFKSLSKPSPSSYEVYTIDSETLNQMYQKFRPSPPFAIAVQAINIGEQACTVAIDLAQICGDSVSVSKIEECRRYFSRTVLLKPIILNSNSIKVVQDTRHINEVWHYLKEKRGYSKERLDHLRKWTLYTWDSIFDDTFKICAFVLLNHNVMNPYVVPDAKICDDFQHPVVQIEIMEVRASYRRCGIGGFMVDFIKKQAQKNGYQVLIISEDESKATWGFWKTKGFKKSIYQDGWYEVELCL